MIGKILGAVLGSRIDRSDGKGGLKGALLGMGAAGLARRVVPLGLLIGGVYAAKQMYDRRRAAETENLRFPAIA